MFPTNVKKNPIKIEKISYHARTARCCTNTLSYFIGSRYILRFLGAILEEKFETHGAHGTM